MKVGFCHAIQGLWSKWNGVLDNCTEKVIRISSVCLPQKARHLIRETHITAAKIATDLFGKAVWLQSTIGNPFMKLWMLDLSIEISCLTCLKILIRQIERLST